MSVLSCIIMAVASVTAVEIDLDLTLDWDDWKLLAGDGEPLSLEVAWAKFATEMGLHRLDDPSPEGILHGNLFELAEIMAERFQYFQMAYEFVKEHNEKYLRGETTFRVSLTSFADLSPSELNFYTIPDENLGKPDGYELRPDARQPEPEPPIDFMSGNETDSDADSRRRLLNWYEPVDWGYDGIPVMEQGTCGSCWAFAASTVANAHVVHAYRSMGISMAEIHEFGFLRLMPSTQELVDCVDRSNGCLGGWAFTAAEYMENYGWSDYVQYPYEFQHWDSDTHPIRENCLRDRKPRRADPGVMVAHYAPAVGAGFLEWHLSHGPLTVSFEVAYDFFFHNYGVYRSSASDCSQHTSRRIPNCSGSDCSWYRGAHAVALMGHNHDNFILQNSWGTNWGNGGFFEFEKGANTCNMEYRGTWSWTTLYGFHRSDFQMSGSAASGRASSTPEEREQVFDRLLKPTNLTVGNATEVDGGATPDEVTPSPVTTRKGDSTARPTSGHPVFSVQSNTSDSSDSSDESLRESAAASHLSVMAMFAASAVSLSLAI